MSYTEYKGIKDRLDTLAKETTLNSLITAVNKKYANVHRKITIDLSTERTDVVLDSNVTGFIILSRTSGATFSIKLGADSDYLTEADLADKEGITEFEPSDLIFSNSAQSGYSVTILYFKRV